MDNITKIKELADKIRNNLDKFSTLFNDELTYFEKSLLKQLIEEKDLPDIEELSTKFNALSYQVYRSNIIEGYKLWVDNYNKLNIIIK